MKSLISVNLLVTLCSSQLLEAGEIRLTETTIVSFATLEEAREVLGSRDEFVEQMSPFDRAVRMESEKPVSEEELLEFMAGTARTWQDDEMDTVAAAIGTISPRLNRLRLNFPERVLMIKSEGAESGAAHTRMNAIVLPQRMVDNRRGNLNRLLAHELLHVLTRHNPDLRRSLYEVIGFRRCNEIELPGQLRAHKITNPDAPWNDSYVTVSVDGQPTPVVPVLFSRESYDPAKGGVIFRYLNFRLLAVESTNGRFTAKGRDGEPVLLDVAQVSGFHEQVGRNTRYIIHPEEIIADNFADLVVGRENLPSPEIVRKIERILVSKEKMD